ncbi:MAG: class I SAM-dependent methyltransferase [Dissulfuribacterales bacterium]
MSGAFDNSCCHENPYVTSCKRDFWQRVFQFETEYLVEHLKGCQNILSVGCGPAMIEGRLAERGFSVTGLDISREALCCAPDMVRTVAGRAEDMSFPINSFDAVIYVASLQFVDDYKRALEKSREVLRPGGRIIVMLLNTASDFFQSKIKNPDSYVNKIKHPDIKPIEETMGALFDIRSEYFLGVYGEEVSLKISDKSDAALYIISGVKNMEGSQNRSVA